jgi:hypothetical protein
MTSKDNPLLTADQVHVHLKNNRATYTEVARGQGTIYSTDEHKLQVQACANEALALLDEFEAEYKRVYQSLLQSRTKKVTPKYVDIKLTRFFSEYFEVELPESGRYGILDIGATAHRAISIYIRENELNNKQFFKLDRNLRELFESPSLEDPSKTYLQLTQERVDELAKDKKEISPSCSNIIHHDGEISMNVAALKILVPKFGRVSKDEDNPDYTPADADKYIPEINEFIEILAVRFDAAKKLALEQAKKEKTANK